MNSRPLVSICIPTYNSADFILDTLNSIRNQTFQNYEVIIQDDASSDSTPKMIRHFIRDKQDARFYLRQNSENLGVEKNWNLCLNSARGEFIKLICADDLLDPDCIRKQVEVLLDPKNLDIACVATQRRIIQTDGKILFPKWFLGGSPHRLDAAELMRKCTLWGTNILGEPCVVLMRASAWKATSGFDARIPYLIDLDLWIKLLKQGDVVIIPEVLCSFRVSNQSSSAQIARKQITQSQEFFQRLYRANPQTIGAFRYYLGCCLGGVLGYARVLIFFLTRIFHRKEGTRAFPTPTNPL